MSGFLTGYLMTNTDTDRGSPRLCPYRPVQSLMIIPPAYRGIGAATSRSVPPEEALDRACGLYLNDAAAWTRPPTN